MDECFVFFIFLYILNNYWEGIIDIIYGYDYGKYIF